MARNLADETLAAILEQCLSVTDKDFTCTNSRASPFANIREPSSNYLVVCKRWMRICTPLLYHTIVLRSQPQATALAAVLKPKAHLEFGDYIRKMRIEGGFGAAAKQILLAAPNITDICITLDLHATDKVEPMCSVMATVLQPQHLVLASSVDWLHRTNKQLKMMLDTVRNCIGVWKTLNCVTTSDLLFYAHENLSRAITSASNIQEICLTEKLVWLNLSEVVDLAREPHIARIVIGQTASTLDAALSAPGQPGLEAVTPELRAKLVFDEELTSSRVVTIANTIAAQIDPFFIPLANVPPPLRLTIWGLVLAATFDFPAEALTRTDFFHPPSRATRSIRYMLVCREWCQVMLSICVARPVLRYSTSAMSFVDFVQSTGLGWRTTRMSVCDDGGGMMRDGLLNVANIIYPALAHLPLLHTLKAHVHFSPHNWLHFCQGPASSIVTLTVTLAAGRYEVPWMPLLVTLDISTNRNIRIELHTKRECVLPTLSHLYIHDYTSTSSLMKFLASQRLPNLSHLSFTTLETSVSGGNQQLMLAAREQVRERQLGTFFSRHGAVVKTIADLGSISQIKFILRHCPNVTSLRMQEVSTPPAPSEVELTSPHESLRELLLPTLYDRHLDTKMITRIIAPWVKFFDAIQPQSLPALRKVIVNQEGMWPTTNHNASKFPLLTVAESLWERGVRLCDVHGMYWKPRLQGRGRKK